jgi:hypothetical protein
MFVQLDLFPELMSSSEVSRAKETVSPEKAQDSTIPAPPSGSKCTDTSSKSARRRSSSKTSAGERGGTSTRSATGSWLLAIESVPCGSALVTLALRTFVPESSSLQCWPTAVARDAKGRDPGKRRGGSMGLESTMLETFPTATANDAKGSTGPGRHAKDSRGRPFQPNLERVLREENFPTPTATPYGSNQGGEKPGPARLSIERHFRQLESCGPDGALFSTPTRSDGASGGKDRRKEGGPDLTAQLENFPTPGASDSESVKTFARGNPSLETAVGEMFSTPTSSNGGEARAMGYSSPKWNPCPTLADQIGVTSRSERCLNPDWVALLMGFDAEWANQPPIQAKPARRAGAGPIGGTNPDTTGNRRRSSAGRRRKPPTDD